MIKKIDTTEMSKIYAVVTTQFEGVHFYRNASGKEEFLKYPHRHLFHIKIIIQQFHDDREVEFINFKRWLNKQLVDKVVNYKSCEMIARELGDKIIKKYGKRELSVEVSEDGENGGLISYNLNTLY